MVKELEKLKKDIKNFCKGKFEIFYCEPFDEENAVISDGEDFKEFLQLAEKLGVKIIYLACHEIENEEGIEPEGKIGFLQLGFYYSNILHLFRKATDWFVEKMEEMEEEEKEVPKELIEKSVEDLSKEMLEFIGKNFREAFEDEEIIRDAQESFWLEKGIDKFLLELKYRIKIEKIEKNVEKHLLVHIRNKEKEILPKLIEGCFNWAKENNLKKLLKSHINVFLSEKGINLTSPSKEVLFNQVNFKLKQSK